MITKKVPAILLLLLLSLSLLTVSAQSAYDSLDVNNINARFYSGGDMFWDLVGFPKFEAPKQSNPAAKRHSMFAASLWVGGLDQSGGLHVAAQTYRQSGKDYWSGPADIDTSGIADFDTIWTITRSEINAFVNEFQANGSIANPGLYPNIYNWPVEYEDINAVTKPLAPFVDINQNQIYEPDSGDYPQMDGDKMLFWVFNDAAFPHTETGGQEMGLKIMAFAYGYDCPATPALNNTLFLKYQIVNSSALTYSDTYIGLWADTDIGLFSDDYVGIDTARGTFFGYNGDPMDEGASGYGSSPPAQGITMLKGPLDDNGQPMDLFTNFVYYENDFSVRGNPTQASHYYNFMQSLWTDSAAMVNNGTTGHPNDGAGPPTRYMFWGDGGWCGNQPSGWSEVSAQNSPFDRRGLASVGPFTMAPGEVNEIIYAFTYARGFYNNNLGSVCELLDNVDTLRAFLANGSNSPCAGNPTSTQNDVWPGDCNSDNIANVFDVLAIGYAYGDTGTARPNATLQWTGQPSPAWGDTLPGYGSDFKHIDCDGDSIIDSLDGLAILQNYNYTHPKGHSISQGGQLLTLSILEDSVMAGDTAHIIVSLGDATNPIDSMYGLAMSISYDPDLVEQGGISVEYGGSWLGTRGTNLYALHKDLHYRGQLDIGLTRINKLNTNGFGKLATINVVTIDNISGKADLIAKTLGFQIVEAEATTRNSAQIEVSYGGDSTIVYQQGSAIQPQPEQNLLHLFPNPAEDIVHLLTEGAYLREITIYNALGQSWTYQPVTSNKFALRLDEFPAGTYIVEAKTNIGVYRKRLAVHK